jgi:hypothetical protein
MTEGCNVIVKTIRAHARQFFGVALFWENELNDIHRMVFIYLMVYCCTGKARPGEPGAGL